MARKTSYDELDDQPAASPAPRRRRASFFGFLSVLAGIAALKVVYRDQISAWMAHRSVPGYDVGQLTQYLYQVGDYQVQAYHVAAAGAGLALLALLWRKMSKRTRAGWPVLGLLLCGAAAGIYRYNSVERVPGTAEYWVQVNVVERVQKMFDKKVEEPKTIETSTPPAAKEEPADVTSSPPAPSEKDNGKVVFPEL